jgi:Family of unknown function (DUF6677)
VSERRGKKQEPTINRWRGALIALAGWAVPGLGHLLLHRWGKALAYFLCVGALAMAGLIMHGEIFGSAVTDIFDRLGFLADLGSGGFYIFARSVWQVVPDMAHASGDYGTRMFAAAGVLNLLTVLEAFEIGCGRRA